MNKKISLLILLLIIGGLYLWSQKPDKRVLSPEETRAQTDRFNQLMLQSIEREQLEQEKELARTKVYNDCIKSYIYQGERGSLHIRECGRRSKEAVGGINSQNSQD